MAHLRQLLLSAAVLAFLVLPRQSAAQTFRGPVASETAWAIESLQLREGSVVVVLGEGGGELSVLIAQRVGPSGHVYAAPMSPDSLAALRGLVDYMDLPYLSVVGDPAELANLRDECCDAVVVRRILHYERSREARAEPLFRLLRTGGLVALHDVFAEVPTDSLARTAIRELEGSLGSLREEFLAAGFSIRRENEFTMGPLYYIEFRAQKP